MPKDPKRNIQSYQIQGGHLNEFEFQKNQSELAEDPEMPFKNETEKPNLAQATKRVAEVTAEAHRIVQQRKKRGLVKAGAQQRSATGKRSVKKAAKKSAKNQTTRAGAKKRASAAGKRSARKVVRKSGKKGTTSAGTKKRASVKSRRKKTVAGREF